MNLLDPKIYGNLYIEDFDHHYGKYLYMNLFVYNSIIW